MKNLFRLNYQLPKRTSAIILFSGFIFFLLIWILFTKEFKNLTLEFNGIEGKSPYSYQLKSGKAYSSDFKGDGNGTKVSGLHQGEYHLVVTDAEGKTRKASIILNENNGDTSVVMDSEAEELGLRIDATVSNTIIPKTTLPSPLSVLMSVKELHFKDALIKNMFYSIRLNIFGYIEAVILSILFGFLIGLIPFFRSLLSRYIDAIRFVALGAVTGLFIQWFGSDINMKVQFLSFGIFVFLLPVVVQRLDEVDKIYTQTSYTLGANAWHTIRYVYWPFVKSKIIDDIRVLTAISWTYIIVAESVDKTGGGLGALIGSVRKVHRYDKLFAILLVIILIGILQDFLFSYIDKKINPHKKI